MKNMAKPKQHKKPFSKAVDHYIRINALTNKDLGLAVGYNNGQMIQAIRSERSHGEETKRRKIAQYFGFTLDAFIEEGRRLMRAENAPPPPAPQIPDVRTERHYRVVDSFKDKNTALEINEILLKIENQRPDRLVMAKKLISALLDDHESDQQKKSIGTGTGE